MDGVSVIATVLNEAGSIRLLLDSLKAQSRPPDEVVIVDGGSRDATVRILREYRDQLPLQWIVAPGTNISQGRNLGIRTASRPLIAVTDAGVTLSRRWLEELIGPFLRPHPPQAVAGSYESAPRTTFELALGATVLPQIREIRTTRFLPSSRSVAFTKAAWEAAGGYPEWLDYCEDVVFDLRLIEGAGAMKLALGAVAHYRPQGRLAPFFRQYYRYARGDGKADLWRLRHGIRYTAYLLGAPLIVWSGFALSPWWWLAGTLVAGLGTLVKPYRRLLGTWPGLGRLERAKAILWIPVIRLTGDVAKMGGYPVGRAWRRRRLGTDPRLSWRARRVEREAS